MTHSIFRIPEILRLIFEHLGPWDISKLTTVSRQFFLCSIPFNWERLSRSGKLRNLVFPGVKLKHMDDAFIRNIRPLDQQALARFNLYTPHVKYLDDRIDGWLGAITWLVILKAVSTRPLLPNLRDCSIYDRDQLMGASQVIRSLLCPSLIRIRASGRREGGTRPVLSPRLMARIAESSPELQTLELHPRYLHPAQLGSDASTPPPVPNHHPISLAQLQSLRTLEAGPEILSLELLTLLGTLPGLESLSICILGDTPEHMVPKHFPQHLHGFSALKHLGIYSEGPEFVLELWQSLSLVRSVTSVYIKIELDLEAADEDVLRDLMSTVCLQSPYLTDLHFELKSDAELVDLDLFTPTVVRNFGFPPLRRLKILVAESEIRLLPPDDFEQLALALSNVEYLETPCLIIPFGGVVAVAQHMPRLRFLAATLYASGWPRASELPSTLPTSNEVLLVRSNFTYGAWYERRRDRKIFYKSLPVVLSRLWLNGARCEFSDLAAGGVQRAEKDGLDQINRTIEQILAPREFKVPNRWELATQWKYSKGNDHLWSPIYGFN